MSKATVTAKLSPEGLYRVNILLDVDVSSEIARINKIAEAIENHIMDLQLFIENCVLADPDPPDPDPPEPDPPDPDPPEPDPPDPDPPDPDPPDSDPEEPDPEEGDINVSGQVIGEEL